MRFYGFVNDSVSGLRAKRRGDSAYVRNSVTIVRFGPCETIWEQFLLRLLAIVSTPPHDGVAAAAFQEVVLDYHIVTVSVS